MKCPNCKKEIYYLKHYESGEMRYYYDGDGYIQIKFTPDDKVLEYECPNCNETLFNNENDAEKFLKEK